MPVVIELEPSSRYERETYNILYVGKFVHKIKGAKHNRNADFSLRVWDNRNRLNDCPEGRYTNFGRYGGPGRYLGPDNVGTDQELSITATAEAVVIALHPLARKGNGDVLEIDQMVLFKIPDGGLLGPYKIAQKALHDPHFDPQPL